MRPLPANRSAARAFCYFGLAKFTIGTKSVNTINVAVQLQDVQGVKPFQPCFLRAYLSDSADGHTLTATACTSALAIGTKGVIIDTPVTEKSVNVLSDATGAFDLNVIQTSGGTNYYLVLVMPDGSLVISSVIAF